MGHVTNEGARRHRQLLGLRRQARPARRRACSECRCTRTVIDAGWVFGHTFVEFTHTGRKTGQPHDAVAMVLHYDGARVGEAVICSFSGFETDWYRNLQAKVGDHLVHHRGHDNSCPSTDSSATTKRSPRSPASGVITRIGCGSLSTVLGWGDLDDDDDSARVRPAAIPSSCSGRGPRAPQTDAATHAVATARR